VEEAAAGAEFISSSVGQVCSFAMKSGSFRSTRESEVSGLEEERMEGWRGSVDMALAAGARL
jgi:hypothetical protein